MRVLGLDVGDRRIGIALSDETGTVAQGRGVYIRQGGEEDLSYFVELCRREGVEKIVVGLPLHMNGSEGEQAAKARAFGEALGARTGLPVEFLDERLTTVEANRVLREAGLREQKKRRVRDQLSAVLILQAWLDFRRFKSA
ncbi:MAG: Putative Holliday junction resolvase [Acetothermia bacterium 64_32]|nr:MAG: Putative Holliday junction resolvase [Acetothermia bacterium 64_32]HAF71531.1 Holliday junction resolvase RuvX [Candidatus Acetothermia bacterium]